MSRRNSIIVLLFLALLLVPSLAEAKKKNLKIGLSGKFEPITRAEMELQEVPFAPGAPAVILFEGEEKYFDGMATGAAVTRTIYQYRVKILDESGVEEYGDFVKTYNKDIEGLKVLARIVLPDGTEIDASENINRDRSETGRQILSLAFPQVQVGAILEIIIQYNFEGFYEIGWPVQGRIPALDKLLVYSPPNNLQVQLASALMTPEETQPVVTKGARGQSMVWSFKDVPPITREPNQPPLIELAKTVYIMPVAWRGPGYNIEFASDWKKWNKNEKELWDGWLRTRQAECKKLSKSITESVDGTANKAEAIRREIKGRVRTLYYSDMPIHRSPDEVLAKGTGSSADIAGVMLSMLRAAGIDANLIPIRHRGDGLMPEAFPMPILFNDIIIGMQAESNTLYFSPAAEFPVWSLPGFAYGVVGMPIDGKSIKPLRLPDYDYKDNKVTREATIEIDDAGIMHVSSVHTFRGITAESWRRRLMHEPEDERRELLLKDLRRWAPGTTLESADMESLEDVTKDLVIRCQFEVEGYLSQAGKRLFINPFLFERMTTEDWSAESRSSMIDLGSPFESLDIISLRLPAGVEEITTPNGADLNAGPAGAYQSNYSREGDMIVARRHLKLKKYRFSAEQYAVARNWFSDMASHDDQAVVLKKK